MLYSAVDVLYMCVGIDCAFFSSFQSETDQISRYLNDNNIKAKVSSIFLFLILHDIVCIV